jgi:hypothetical protein
MRRNLCALALLALMTAAILPTAARAETTVRHFNGISAYASFTSYDSTGCIITYTDVSVYEDVTRTSGSSTESSYAYLNIFQYDSCQNLYLSELFGDSGLAPGAFDTRGKIHSARLATTLEAYDYLTNTTVPVSIDLAWTAVGDVLRGSSSFRSIYAHTRLSSHQVGSSSAADVVGSVVLGGTNLTPQPSDYGSIYDTQNGTIYTSH